MDTTGEFIAIVSVFGRARDSKGEIINRDPNDLPTMWLTTIAGKMPNRQALAGTVVQRMGIPMDRNGIIPVGEDRGNPDARRVIYGQWLHQSDHELFGPQFSWNVIKDLSTASVKEINEAKEYLGAPEVFILPNPQLPEDYRRKTTQHIGRNRMDPMTHGTAGQTTSRPVEIALRDLGPSRSDVDINPEVQIAGESANILKGAVPPPMPGPIPRGPLSGQPNPENPNEILQ